MEKKLFEEKISSQIIFEGEIVNLYFDKVKLPNNRVATREKVTHPGAVGIVPVTRNNEIILIRQFRYPVGDVLIEIPAGKLGKGEPPYECAKRELEEEIGAVGGTLINICTFYTSPGFCNEILYLYLALDFEEKENSLDEDEFLQVFRVKLGDSLDMIKSGTIKDAKTIIGILMARDYIGNL
ncbi:MAG: NUDIX hydrolase [Actinobacteria bacterium]|nr:NUDIX hydrolase [Actinomycetota bacterium]